MKIWIYNRDTNKISGPLNREDSRFDWNWRNSPAGMVRMVIRRSKYGDKYFYVYHGESRDELLANVNRKIWQQIDSHEQMIEELRKELVVF